MARAPTQEGVFAGDWQRAQADRLDSTVRRFRAAESSSSSGWAASAAASDWHAAPSLQAEFGNMRLAGAQPAGFSPERYVQYIRGRPVVVLLVNTTTHSSGTTVDQTFGSVSYLYTLQYSSLVRVLRGMIHYATHRRLCHSNVSSSPVALIYLTSPSAVLTNPYMSNDIHVLRGICACVLHTCTDQIYTSSATWTCIEFLKHEFHSHTNCYTVCI